jgi:hypothetical protein
VTVLAGGDIFEVTISRRAEIGRGASRCNGMVKPSGYITENIKLVQATG